MPVGSFGHGGAFATNGWIDQERQMSPPVFLVQTAPIQEGGKARDSFQRTVMDAFGVLVSAPKAEK